MEFPNKDSIEALTILVGAVGAAAVTISGAVVKVIRTLRGKR